MSRPESVPQAMWDALTGGDAVALLMLLKEVVDQVEAELAAEGERAARSRGIPLSICPRRSWPS